MLYYFTFHPSIILVYSKQWTFQRHKIAPTSLVKKTSDGQRVQKQAQRHSHKRVRMKAKMEDTTYQSLFLRFYRVLDQNINGNGNRKYGNGDNKKCGNDKGWRTCLFYCLGIFPFLAIKYHQYYPFPPKKKRPSLTLAAQAQQRTHIIPTPA